jgi:hypothetical protein
MRKCFGLNNLRQVKIKTNKTILNNVLKIERIFMVFRKSKGSFVKIACKFKEFFMTAQKKSRVTLSLQPKSQNMK